MNGTVSASGSYRVLETPTGPFLIMEEAGGSLQTGWLQLSTEIPQDARHAPKLLPELTKRFQRYFDGEDVDFSDIPLPEGAPFHRACWRAARAIPRGECSSYAQLAQDAGRRSASRAAGQAMRRNPLPIIVPCHRVVATGGKLGGFSGTSNRDHAALCTKRTLLRLEGHALTNDLLQVLPTRNPNPVG